MKNEPKDLAVVHQGAEALIAQAIDKNVPVETMERLLAMRRELKAEHAKEEFDKAMADFQARCPIIEKKDSAGNGNYNYKYASLDHIVKQVKDLLAENGFSYTFDTKKTDHSLITYCKVKHKAGHMEVSEFEIAIDTSARMNISQKDGAANSYGKRYAFCNAFGILTGDEDTDVTDKPLKPSEMRGAMESQGQGVQQSSQATTKSQTSIVDDNGNGFVATEKQLTFIKNLLEKKGYTEKDLEIKYEVTNMSQLTKEQAGQVITNLLDPKTPAKKKTTNTAELVDPDEAEEGINKMRSVN